MAEEKEYRQSSKDSTRQRAFFNLGHTLQILKAAFPYMDRRSKKTMDLFIKAGDLFESLNGINNDASVSAISLDEGDKIDMVGMLKEIRKVCHDNEVKIIDMLLNVMNAMELYETYVNLYSMMASQGDGLNGLGNLFGMDSSSTNPEDMIDMLSAMLPPEDKETLDNINMVLKMMSNTKSTNSSSNDASSKEASDEDTSYKDSPEDNDFYYDDYNTEYKSFHDLKKEEDDS